MNSGGNETGHLTPDTIRDYLRGNLNGRAMHEVEAHLLECGFCSDAVEGFELSERSQVKTDQAMLALRKKLNQKIREHDHPRMIKWPAWSAAAAGIALAIAGYVIIKQREDEQKLLAIEQSENFLRTDENDTLIIFLPEAPEVVASNPVARTSAYAPATDSPQAASAAPDPGNQESAVTSARIITQHNDSQLTALKSTIPAEAEAQRQAAVARPVRPSPVVGIKAYEKYLSDSLRYPSAALEERIEGEVEVQFTIRPSGRPAAFQVTRSLGYGCDEEAIRLIADGPDWKAPLVRGQQQPARAVQTVKFELPADENR